MHKDDMQRLFLDMQEHPENYSDEQLERMMTDIDRESDTDAAWQRFNRAQLFPSHQGEGCPKGGVGSVTETTAEMIIQTPPLALHTPSRPDGHPAPQRGGEWRGMAARQRFKIAAIFVGVLAMAGIALAAVQWIASPSPSQGGDVELPVLCNQTPPPLEALGEAVQFSNAPLDSILNVVSAHYGKAVSFRDEAPRRMKLIMTWQPDAPLTDFIERLNAFDGLSLSLQNDTIVVRTNKEEGKQ